MDKNENRTQFILGIVGKLSAAETFAQSIPPGKRMADFLHACFQEIAELGGCCVCLFGDGENRGVCKDMCAECSVKNQNPPLASVEECRMVGAEGVNTIKLITAEGIYGLLIFSRPNPETWEALEPYLWNFGKEVAQIIENRKKTGELLETGERLRESEARYRALVEMSPDAIFVHVNGRFVYANRAGLTLLGAKAPEELLGREIIESVHPDYRHLVKSRTHSITEHSAIAPLLEEKFVRLDGSVVDVEVVGAPVVYGGQPAVQVVARDITDRKKAKAALLESRYQAALFADLIERSSQPVGVGFPDGRLGKFNQAYLDLVGYTQEEIKTLDWARDLTPAECLPIERAKLRELHKTGKPVRYEKEYIRKDGSLVPVELLVHLIADDSGQPKCYYAFANDITERKESEKNISRLAAAVEQSADDIIITDTGGIIQYVNPAFTQTTGYSFTEAAGRHINMLLRGRHTEEATHLEVLQELKAGHIWKGRILNLAKDGRNILQEVTISPIKRPSGEIIGYVSTQRDITRQVEVETHAAEAQKLEAIGTLAGGIAHDFNNILSAIVGYTELVMDEVTDPMVREDLQGIFKASTRAKDLVKQILMFSRKGSDAARPVQLKPLVKEALKLLRASIPATIEFKADIKSEASVMADPTDIHRIIVNLCTNAAIAMKEHGGLLEVGLEDVELDLLFTAKHTEAAPGKFVRLTVRDTGVGMTPEVRARIFEPFFTTRPHGEGSGMGLAVVHGLVARLGGTISVNSEQGKGSAFQLFFPVLHEEAAFAPEIHEPPLPGTERILFVDDEVMVANIIFKALEKLGYKVTARTSSMEAYETFRANPKSFDIVITDMTMPVMTGDELIFKIRTIRPDIPAILCTGYSELITEEKAKSLGIEEFYMKPFVIQKLTGIIRKLMDNPALGLVRK
ncbi:PAS domain S-box protein [bacterium]|nr:MAG: PAS domain S-box protein [bacterium]